MSPSHATKTALSNIVVTRQNQLAMLLILAERRPGIFTEKWPDFSYVPWSIFDQGVGLLLSSFHPFAVAVLAYHAPRDFQARGFDPRVLHGRDERFGIRWPSWPPSSFAQDQSKDIRAENCSGAALWPEGLRDPPVGEGLRGSPSNTDTRIARASPAAARRRRRLRGRPFLAPQEKHDCSHRKCNKTPGSPGRMALLWRRPSPKG